MRYGFVAFFIFLSVFSAQLNPLAGGTPEKLSFIDDKYVVAAGDLIYIFSPLGKLERYIVLEGVSDFEVSDSILVATLTSQDFPNVRAFSFPELKPLWTFNPEMEVFDINLVWDKKQTRSWDVEVSPKGFVVSSGYSVYALNEKGELVGNFTTKNDIWKTRFENYKYYLSTQEGSVYILDQDFNELEKKNVCPNYELREQVSNKSVSEFTRSVWDSTTDVALCENGNLIFFDGRRPVQMKEYSSFFLHNNYDQNRRPTGFGSQLFKNIKLKLKGSLAVAYTSDKFYIVESGIKVDTSVFALDIFDEKIYVLELTKYLGELLKIYNKQGKLLDSFPLKALKCQDVHYEILAGTNTLIASSCEIKLIDSTGKVLWYLPRSTQIDVEKNGNLTVFFMDDKNQQSRSEFYGILGLTKFGTWTYFLPRSMALKGYLSEVEIFPRSNRVILSYNSDDSGKLIILNAMTGALEVIRNVTERKFVGNLDKYFVNESNLNFLDTFDFDEFRQIPREYIDNPIENLEKFSVSDRNDWDNLLKTSPIPPKDLESLSDIFDDKNNYLFSSEIRNIDSCDYNGDGYQDLIITSNNYFVILSGRDLSELILKNNNRWIYDNELLASYRLNETSEWFMDVSTILCVDGVTNDEKGNLFFTTYNGTYSLVNSNGTLVWRSIQKNLMSERVMKIGDINGDGLNDILIPQWIQDKPDRNAIISSKTNMNLFDFSSWNYFLDSEIGDVNNDGVKESALISESEEGVTMTVFSQKYLFEYSGVSDFWDVSKEYGRVMPVEIIPDRNDDGFNEIVIGITRKWGEEAAVLVIFDGKTKELLKLIQVEGETTSIEKQEWTYINDIQLFGSYLVFSIPSEQKSGKLAIYDLNKSEVVAFVNRDVKQTISFNESLLMIGRKGEVFEVNFEQFKEPEVSVKGPEIIIKHSTNYFVRVYIDGVLSASGTEKEFNLKVSNGKHILAVSFTNTEGVEKFFTQEIQTFASSDLSFLNKIFWGILLAFIGFKLVRKWI